jgi:hypothetical protein
MLLGIRVRAKHSWGHLGANLHISQLLLTRGMLNKYVVRSQTIKMWSPSWLMSVSNKHKSMHHWMLARTMSKCLVPISQNIYALRDSATLLVDRHVFQQIRRQETLCCTFAQTWVTPEPTFSIASSCKIHTPTFHVEAYTVICVWEWPLHHKNTQVSLLNLLNSLPVVASQGILILLTNTTNIKTLFIWNSVCQEPTPPKPLWQDCDHFLHFKMTKLSP